MEIKIPLFCIDHKNIGGTESAIYNIVNALSLTNNNIEVIYSNEARISREFIDGFTLGKIAVSRQFVIPGPKNVRFFEEAIFELTRDKCDCVLYPNYFIPPRLVRRSSIYSTMLYDIQYKSLPQYHSDKRRAWLDFYLPRMFNAADRVFLISDNELALVDYYFGKKASDKCRVAYLPIDWSRFGPKRTAEIDKHKQYLLCVFHPFPHKNTFTIIEAFVKLSRVYPDLHLKLVGNLPQSTIDQLLQGINHHVSEKIEFTGFVSDAQLGALYSNCAIFLLPSLYEGFGMPAVEALGLGARVLVSEIPALREVTLGLATYIEAPTSADSWVEAIMAELGAPTSANLAVSEIIRKRYDPRVIGSEMVNLINH